MKLVAPLLALALSLSQAPCVSALWPQPSYMTNGTTALRLDPHSFQIHLPSNAPADLHRATQRTLKSLRATKSKPLQVGRGAERAKTVHAAKQLHSVNVVLGKKEHKRDSQQHAFGARSVMNQNKGGSVQSIYDAVTGPIEDVDEEYSLHVPEDGSPATLTANTAIGALRGLTTLEQMLWTLPSNGGSYLWGAPFDIKDKPAFPYRGFMMDTSRNWFSVSSIKRQLDGMAMVKMSTLHWHITDAQSWPLKLRGDYARLAEFGAYSSDQVYDEADVRDVVQYAADRGINVAIEIDMPGHQLAGVEAMPGNLISCGDHLPWSDVANEPPSGQLDLRNKQTYTFIDGLIEQVAPMFPGRYFSTGGDEVNLACYGAKNNSDIDDSLLKPFVENAHAALAKAGKVPMVWEEMAIDFPETGKTLPKGTIVETWTGPDNVKKVLEANDGVRLIHAPVTSFYLDCGRGEGLASLSASWCTYVTWENMYMFDPFNGTQGIEGGRERILGGEAPLWAEQVDETNIDSLAWPRLASAAEGEHFPLRAKISY